MKRTYEAMVLLDNREVRNGWQNLKDQVCGVFQKHGAEVRSARRWDERRLAFPIQHQLRGTYMLVYFDSETGSLQAIRRDLDYFEPVLRHLTLVCEAIPESAFAAEDAFDEASIRVEDTATARAAAAEAAAEERPSRPTRGGRGEPKPVEEPAAETESSDTPAEAPAEAKAEAPEQPEGEAKAEAKGDAKDDDKGDER